MVEWLSSLIESLDSGESVALATVVGPEELPARLLGRKLLVRPDATSVGTLGASTLDARVAALCRGALGGPPTAGTVDCPLEAGEAEVLEVAPDTVPRLFVEVVQPPPTLLIVGAGHIAQPLSRMGRMLGFAVAVLDDRPAFASRERFPEADLVVAGDLPEELARLPVSHSTYVVLVTRGHAQDEEALRQVIGSRAAYIGMIGSRRRVRAVLDRMRREGVTPEQVSRVCSPIGLEIGAETPEEIAVSILAEVIHARRRGGRHPAARGLGVGG